MVFLYIAVFLALQVVANLFFKWGSLSNELYWWGFLFGNLVGISSIIFMILMYRNMPCAATIAVGTGGTFVLNQLVMFLVYKEHLTPWACCGLVMIVVGILLTAFLNNPPSTHHDDERTAAARVTEQLH